MKGMYIMAFDGIVTSNIVAELNTCLIGGKINKVFEPNKNEVILGIYSHGVNYALNFSISSASTLVFFLQMLVSILQFLAKDLLSAMF